MNWMEMYRDRKAGASPFKAQHNFQLRVRKSVGGQPQQQQQQQQFGAIRGLESGAYQGMRVRKAILQVRKKIAH